MKRLLLLVALSSMISLPVLAHNKKQKKSDRGQWANCPISVWNFDQFTLWRHDSTEVDFRNMSNKGIKALEGEFFTKDAFGRYHNIHYGAEWEDISGKGKPLMPGKGGRWIMYNFHWYGSPGHMGFRLTRLLYSDGTEWKPDPKCEWTGPEFQHLNQ